MPSILNLVQLQTALLAPADWAGAVDCWLIEEFAKEGEGGVGWFECIYNASSPRIIVYPSSTYYLTLFASETKQHEMK